MLERLHIKNLALVTELDLEFGPGLNTVTGETGAGKSLIIGAVQLLAGGRAAPGLIRKGARSCEVTGVLRLDDSAYQELLNETDARLEAGGIPPCEEGCLLVRRVVTESGSRAYVNGTMVTSGFLKELCGPLIDLHGPHDNQTLLLPAMQLKLLDTYGGLQAETAAVRNIYDSLAAIRKEREQLRSEGLAPEEADLLAYQLKEIDAAELKVDEEEALLQKYRLSSHAQRLMEISYSVQNALCGDEGSLTEQLATQLRKLHELEQLDPERGGQIVTRIEGISESLRDAGYEIGEYAASLDVDQEELEQISRRLDLIQKLKRKYGPSLEDVLECGERIRGRLERLRNLDGMLQDLAKREETLTRELAEKCNALHKRRADAATRLAAAIQEKLQSLGFAKSAFAVNLKTCEPGPTGADTAEYAFAPNVGEAMQPLRQVASSGEVARVMLAIKAVLSDADSVPVLIFDEIDANVGGRVAVSVARELRGVGERHQVFSITHLPQIAAAGNRHYLVEKHVEDGRTQTNMSLLEGKRRLDEIVRMLGAAPGETTAVAHAKELLKNWKK